MTSHHGNRVADRVRRILARIIGEDLNDPRVGLVTLTDVKLSTDKKHALGFVTIMGIDEPGAALEALNRAAPFLRRKLAQRAGLRFTPELKFVEDELIESGQRLERLFDEMRQGWRASDES